MVAAIGIVLGASLGAHESVLCAADRRRDVVGMRLDYAFPTVNDAQVPIIAAAALIAAIWPAESAVQGSLVEALEYE